MFLKRPIRKFLNLETKERGSVKAKEKIILLSRKRERNLPKNIVQNMAMIKTTVGNYIQN